MRPVHRIHHDGSLWWYVAHFTRRDDGTFASQVWEYTDVDDDVTGEGHFRYLPLAHTKIGTEQPVPGVVTSHNYQAIITRHLNRLGWTIRSGSHPEYVPKRERYEVGLALPAIIPGPHHRTNGLAHRVSARVGHIVDAVQLGIQTTVCDPDDVARTWTTTNKRHHDGLLPGRNHHAKEDRLLLHRRR